MHAKKKVWRSILMKSQKVVFNGWMPAFAGMTAILFDIYSFIVIPAQAGGNPER
ncbi:MAG: hypothetical protein P8X90_03395 [Desulfobacterales bacterium]|jgi:hypothetical protein